MPETMPIVLPDLRLPVSGLPETEINLRQFAKAQGAKWLVLYFYPKDSTPGCTTEAQGFRDHYTAFQAAGAVIVGVSRDAIRSHDNFRCKQELPFPLLSDKEETLCDALDIIKQKMMYGKQVRGIERSTFIATAEGEIVHVWRGVKVPGHVEAVLAYLQQQSA